MTSKIEWTELTWNPVTGCTKVSEGCQNCYACRMHNRLAAMGNLKYSYAPFSQVCIHTHEVHRYFPGKGKLIFVNSMSDSFHDELGYKQIRYGILENIIMRPQHTFQLLTKRSHRLKEFDYPENVWLGVSVELAKYKNRIDDLRKTNAKVKFISFEPLLGDVGELDLSGIDWVIVGGESGPGARPMHPDWVRNIRDQALAQGCKFMFKQWGEWVHLSQTYCICNKSIQTHKWSSVLSDVSFKFGKKKAGRMLDGRIWDEFPER